MKNMAEFNVALERATFDLNLRWFEDGGMMRAEGDRTLMENDSIYSLGCDPGCYCPITAVTHHEIGVYFPIDDLWMAAEFLDIPDLLASDVLKAADGWVKDIENIRMFVPYRRARRSCDRFDQACDAACRVLVSRHQAVLDAMEWQARAVSALATSAVQRALYLYAVASVLVTVRDH